MSTSLERGLRTFKEQIDAPIASFLNSCVRCGMCADACLFYQTTGDPKYTPIHKVEPLRRAWKQEYTFWGRFAKALGISKPITDEELSEWQELLYDSCTLCGRCSLVCPVGNDIAYMIRKAREGMVAAGHAPQGLKTASINSIEAGGPMRIPLETFQKKCAIAEKNTGIKIPFDVEGADYLLLMSSSEIMQFDEFIGSVAKIFKQANVSWTYSSEAFEATNSGIQIGSSDIAAELVERIVGAAEKLRVKAVISPECGHAYTAIRWEGPNLIGRPYSFKVLHILELLDQLREEGRLVLEDQDMGHMTFHDPCQLVRRGGVLEQPVNLVKMVAGNYVPMPDQGKWNWCCGGGGGVSANEDARELQTTAFKIKKEQIEATGAKSLITSCSNCRNVIEEALEEYDMDIEVLGLSEMIAEHLKIDNKPQESES
jgi:Fe-S oxidoreductase